MCRLLDARSFWQTILVNCMQLHGKQEQWIQHTDFLAPVLGYRNDASDLDTSFCAITGSDQHYHFHRSLVAHITWSSSDFFFFFFSFFIVHLTAITCGWQQHLCHCQSQASFSLGGCTSRPSSPALPYSCEGQPRCSLLVLSRLLCPA